MNTILHDDLYRYVGEKSKSLITRIRYILLTPGFQYIYLFRHTQNASNLVTKLFWGILLKLCSFKFGIQIPPQTKIGKGFRIVHWGTIVVNPGTIIGKNFNISQGCLIGNAQGKNRGTPIIGNNVCMNANSLILGGYVSEITF
jgi:serine O-acetyltransferase